MRNAGFVFSALIALFAGSIPLVSAAANDTINGIAVDSVSNAPIDSVTVASEGVSVNTSLTGSFKLVIPATGIFQTRQQETGHNITWNAHTNIFSWSGNSRPSIRVQNALGRLVAGNEQTDAREGELSIAHLPQGLYWVTVSSPLEKNVYAIMKFQAGTDNSCKILVYGAHGGGLLKIVATGKAHTLVFSKTGYKTSSVVVPVNTLTTTLITAKLVAGTAYTVLFDGTSLTNWVYNSNASLKDSSIQMTGCWCMAWSKQDYDNFRLFVTCRVVNTDYTSNPGQQHMGIGIWGARRTDFVPAACLEITPQNCWLWDYINNNGPNTTQTCLQTNGGGTAGWNTWKTTEILANLKNGTVKTAVDGVPMTNFKVAKLSLWQKGPIGLQDHGNNPVEYKNIKIEVNPADTNLVSVVK